VASFFDAFRTKFCMGSSPKVAGMARYSDGLDDPGSISGIARFLFATAPRPTLGPTQSSVRWVPGALSPVVKWQRREADHSSPYSADIKNGRAMLPLLHTSSWHNA
jgi:hypothetical protein